jgi:hypothetical protein
MQCSAGRCKPAIHLHDRSGLRIRASVPRDGTAARRTRYARLAVTRPMGLRIRTDYAGPVAATR